MKPPTPVPESTAGTGSAPPATATPPPEPQPAAAPKLETQPAAETQVKVEVAERAPLSIVVVDAPAAEPEVLPETQVEVPVRAPVRIRPTVEEPPEAPRIPYPYWLLIAAVLGFLLLSFKNIYQPFIVHVEDSVERRVFGEPSKIYQAPHSNPHTTRQKQRSKLKWW